MIAFTLYRTVVWWFDDSQNESNVHRKNAEVCWSI